MKIAKFTFALFGINTYVVWDPATRKCAVIDPGMINDEERTALDRFITREGLTVTHVINTHLHIDHAIGDSYAAEKYAAEILAHPDDSVLGERLSQQAAEFGLPFDVRAVKGYKPLRDGETIHIGDGTLKVLHVPGHSPGGIALYDEADGFVIAGDSLFEGSIGRTDLPGGDYDTLIGAVKAKLLSLPDSTVVYPGHGPATTVGAERRGNPFLR